MQIIVWLRAIVRTGLGLGKTEKICTENMLKLSHQTDTDSTKTLKLKTKQQKKQKCDSEEMTAAKYAASV